MIQALGYTRTDPAAYAHLILGWFIYLNLAERVILGDAECVLSTYGTECVEVIGLFRQHLHDLYTVMRVLRRLQDSIYALGYFLSPGIFYYLFSPESTTQPLNEGLRTIAVMESHVKVMSVEKLHQHDSRGLIWT